MILSTSFFCDNSLRLVYIYIEPDCDFNSNCLKPGKLYFAESSNSWIKYVSSITTSAFLHIFSLQILCAFWVSLHKHLLFLREMTNSSGFHLNSCCLLSAGSVTDSGSALSTVPAELPRNSSEGLVCLWLLYILGNFLVGNVSETRDNFVSSFLSYMPLFNMLASILKITLTRARRDTVGGSPHSKGNVTVDRRGLI